MKITELKNNLTITCENENEIVFAKDMLSRYFSKPTTLSIPDNNPLVVKTKRSYRIDNMPTRCEPCERWFKGRKAYIIHQARSPKHKF